MVNVNSKTGYYSALLFLIWPLLALAASFRNYRSGWAKNVLWAFVAFYGFAFAIGVENDSADIVRYISEYQRLHEVSMTLPEAYTYFIQTGEVDVVKTILAIVLSRFSSNPSVLTLAYGIIFGFFFSRNMWFVLEHLEGRMKFVTVILFISFTLIVPIWNMNGFRMWTAAHVYIYGLLPYLFDGNKGKLVVAASSVLVHYAFLVPVGVLVGYSILGNRPLIYFSFFLATFFISEINLEVFNNVVEQYAPESLQERTEGYRGEQYVENYREGAGSGGRVWYANFYGVALKWSVMGFLIILFFRAKTFFEDNNRWMSLFCFTLLIYGVANVFSSLPSGGRYVAVANLCAIALITLYIQNREQEIVMERFVWVASPALMLFIIVSLRMGLYSMSATAILGNPIIALFLTGDHMSLNDVMKSFLR